MARKKRNDGSLSLTSWKELDPSYARANRSALIDLVGHLTTLPEKWRATLTCALTDGPSSALHQLEVAIQLESQHQKSSGLSRTWLLVAAAHHGVYGARAALILALHLVGLSHKLERALGESEVKRIRDLGAKWLLHAADFANFDDTIEAKLFVVAGHDERKALARALEGPAAPSKPAADDPFSMPDPVPLSAPSMVVVKQIGITICDRDDRAFVESWKFLTEPLPLAAGPRPELLRTILSTEFPWMGEAIDRIVSDLALRRSAGILWDHWRPLLLVGPPGSGKTRFARRLAELVGTGFGEVSAAGSSDNRALQGTARGWSSTSPSLVLYTMRQSKTANPVILVDEIDKTRADGRNGDIRSTLLTMLEPISAKAWPDEALMASADLSAVNWILAANDATPIRGPLLTRLRVVNVPAPSSEHYPAIVEGVRRDIGAELGVRPEDLPRLDPETEIRLAEAMRRGISIRRVRAAYEAGLQHAGGVTAGRVLN